MTDSTGNGHVPNRRPKVSAHVCNHDFGDIRDSDHSLSMIQDLISYTVSITSESLRRLHTMDFVAKKNIYRFNRNWGLCLGKNYEDMLSNDELKKMFLQRHTRVMKLYNM
jgi:hypothetical protein